ncbi:hypothetical protein P8452_44761 [Trifolium repens]|nr:hypothetical protein P8452_44761 [Trifolium repens]
MLEGADERKYVPEWVYKVLKKVERKKNKLISNRDIVELNVDTIDRKIEKVSDDVLDWLRETDILLQEIENLKTQLKVPSWNEFKKLQERIKALNVKYNKFDSFSTPIPSLERFSSRSAFMCFKSIKKASDELLVALKDDDCSVIGLYGRRGSGKTTLVKAMSVHDEENSLSSKLLNVARDVVYECDGLPGKIIRRNSYEIAMAKQEEKFRNDPEKVKKWRSALSEVAGLSGFSHHKTRQEYEYKLIRKIVERVNNNRLCIESIDMD